MAAVCVVAVARLCCAAHRARADERAAWEVRGRAKAVEYKRISLYADMAEGEDVLGQPSWLLLRLIRLLYH